MPGKDGLYIETGPWLLASTEVGASSQCYKQCHAIILISIYIYAYLCE